MKNDQNNLPQKYTIKVARSLEQVEQLRGIWERLQWHPNADIDFYLTILASRQEILRPHVISLSSNGHTRTMMIGRIEEKRFPLKLGYATLYTPKVRSLTVIYGGLLGDWSDGVTDALIAELQKSLARGEADVAELHFLKLDSAIYKLAKKKPSFLCRDHTLLPNLHWIMNVPATVEDFYQRLKRKPRYNLKRTCRVFDREFAGKVVFECITSEKSVERLCCDAERIASRTYQRGLGVGFVDNLENRRRVALEASRGRLRAYIAYIADNPCAFWMGTLHGKKIYIDFTAYDPKYSKYSLGKVFMMKMLEDICAKTNVQEIDFGFGDALYKRFFSDHKWEEASIFIFAPAISTVSLNFMRTVTFYLSRLAQKILRDVKLEQKIKKFWRAYRSPNSTSS